MDNNAANRNPPMDRFTRNYLIFLGGLAGLLLAWWASTIDPRVWEINDQLAADPMLAAYPYPFRVKSIHDGVAQAYSPRSARIPALRFLAIIRPQLRGRDSNDPAVIAAQRELAEHQAHARKLILAHPEVTKLRWVEDIDWYRQHGIDPL
jgi:hypothetical protein